MSAAPAPRLPGTGTGKEMMTVKARKARFAAALAAAALAAVACGGAGEGNEADVVTQATSAPMTAPAPPTSAAPATAVPPVTTAAASGLPTDAMELLHASTEASMGRSVRGVMSLSLPGPDGDAAPLTARFEADADGDVAVFINLDEVSEAESGAPEDAPASSIEMEYRFVDGLGYARLVVPPESRDRAGADLPPDGWFTLGPETADAIGLLCPSSIMAQAVAGEECPPPPDLSALFAAAAGAEIVGEEELDGTATTRIDVAVDLAVLAEAASSTGMIDDDGLSGLLLSGFFPDDLIVSFWVDEDALMRRVSIDLGSMLRGLLGAFAQGTDELADEMPQLGQVVDFHDYDTEITIEAPPADEIIGDFGDLGDPTGFGMFDGQEASGISAPAGG